MAKILAVDGEPSVLRFCRDELSRHGYRVETAACAADAVDLLVRTPFDLVLSDLEGQVTGGTGPVQLFRAVSPGVPIVILAEPPSLEGAVEAMRDGASDVVSKPLDGAHLCRAVERSLSARGRSLRVTRPRDHLHGKSPRLRSLLKSLEKAASVHSHVLIQGESGTGKELAARTMHGLSDRRQRPFVVLDCKALPADQQGRELFGTQAGGGQERRGLLEAAQGGTLFLDEVGELAMPLQARLLRVLEEGQIQGHEGHAGIPVDVRVAAATRQDLVDAVQCGRFREDLYFRLNIIPIHVPALRERREDIPLLAEAFLREFSRAGQHGPSGWSTEAMQRLSAATWPGNVRELRNAVERMISLAPGEEIGAGDVPPEVLISTPSRDISDEPVVGFREAKNKTISCFEREYLHRLLAEHCGNVTRSAQAAGMKRSALQRLMRKHQLMSSSYRTPSALKGKETR